MRAGNWFSTILVESTIKREGPLQSRPGTYALVCRCENRELVPVGCLGACQLREGYYVYVGSAFGPGGVRARVMRHRRREKRRHWHVDYLREHVSVAEVWYTHDPVRREHQWVEAMNSMGLVLSFNGFGSSDCTCFSHLLHSRSAPLLREFIRTIGQNIPLHQPIEKSSMLGESGDRRRPGIDALSEHD